MMNLTFFLISVLVFTLSCSHKVPKKQDDKLLFDFPPVFTWKEVPIPESFSKLERIPMSSKQIDIDKKVPPHIIFKALFMADGQFSNIFAGPTVWRTKTADTIPVAIRPPRLDFFSKDLMKWGIDKFGNENFLFHLGDALNIACQNEWETFVRSIRPEKNGRILHRGWLMAPGNHDFFFLGNTLGSRLRKKKGLKKSWIESCQDRGPDRPRDKDPKKLIMTKDIYVKKYVDEILAQGKLFPKDFPIKKEDIKCDRERRVRKSHSTEPRTGMVNCTWNSPNKNSFLQKIAYGYPTNGDIRVSYKAYIYQMALLPPRKGHRLRAVLLDTTNYKRIPTIFGGMRSNKIPLTLSYSPALTGRFLPHQFQTVSKWLEDTGRKELTVFMGHHPKKMLAKKSKAFLGKLLEKSAPSLFISAHTHNGYIDKKGGMPEINIGSTTDWPPHMLSLGLNIEKESVVPFPRYLHPVEINENTACRGNQDSSAGGTTYLEYQLEKGDRYSVQDHTLNYVLRGYKEMYQFFGLLSPTFKRQFPVFNKLESFVSNPSQCNNLDKNQKRPCLGEKIRLLKSLDKVDKRLARTSLRYGKLRLEYGACQAAWASKAEFLYNRLFKYLEHDLWNK